MYHPAQPVGPISARSQCYGEEPEAMLQCTGREQAGRTTNAVLTTLINGTGNEKDVG